MTKLYVTHPNFNFNLKNPHSILLDNTSTKLSCTDYHVSLGDLPIDSLLAIFRKFDEIEFVSDGFLSDQDITTDTLQFLSFAKQFVKVTNLPQEKILSFSNSYSKINQDRQLWIFGCSISHGVGLQSCTETYGHQLANFLNLPINLITKIGSSTHWSLRQIVNLPINKNDLVIWQITSPYRISQFNGKHVQEIVLNNSKNKTLVDTYNDEQCFFLQLSLINIGVQFLKKLGVEFYIIDVDKRMQGPAHEYEKYSEYFCAKDFIVDYGNDNQHFGPLSHKKLALQLLNHVQLKNV